jgi:hypothetical protein
MGFGRGKTEIKIWELIEREGSGRVKSLCTERQSRRERGGENQQKTREREREQMNEGEIEIMI